MPICFKSSCDISAKMSKVICSLSKMSNRCSRFKLVKKLDTVHAPPSSPSPSVLTEAQHPSPEPELIDTLALLPIGTSSCTAAPDGIMTVSMLVDGRGGLGVCDKAIEGGLEGGADAVGTPC